MTNGGFAIGDTDSCTPSALQTLERVLKVAEMRIMGSFL